MSTQASDRLGDIQEYYFSTKLDEIRRMNAEGANVLNLGIGSPDMPPSPGVITALNESATDASSHSYQSYKGIPQLRAAMASYTRTTYGVELDAKEEILPLLGSKEGISHISMAFINPGDEVLVPNPGYPSYAAATHLAGGVAIPYDLEEDADWAIDLDKLKQTDLSKVKLMWVNYPNMPTGSRGSAQLLQEIVHFAVENDILICHDNPYSRILNGRPLSMLSCSAGKEHVLELNSLSKSHNMAGWRLGWLSGNAEHIKTVLRYKSNIDSGMFLPVQMGGVAALNEGDDWFDSLNSEYESRRELAWRLLDNLNCTYSKEQSGLFVWAKMNENESGSEEFCDSLLGESKVFLAPETVFGSNGEGYVRVSLCSKVEVLKEAVKRISEFASNRQP